VLVDCRVPTGWGSAVNTANVAPGDMVAVYGVGGIGINAVQGARYAGAKNVVAIDPLENKREKAMELGATHAFATVWLMRTLAVDKSRLSSTLHNDYYRLRRSGAVLVVPVLVVPSHGRCRISLIMSGAMSEGGPYDKNVRRALAGGH